MTTDNRPTIAERQAAKRAERRARKGLPPNGTPITEYHSERRMRLKIKAAAERRNADRIDGYDRDDLGESPDY